MLIPLGILASAGGVPPIVSDYDLLETNILGSAQASITFSSLGTYAADYKHLQVRYTARSNRSGFAMANLGYEINGVTANNYAGHLLDGNGSSVRSAAGTSIYGYLSEDLPASSATANSFGVGVIDLVDIFTTTKNKVIRSVFGRVGDGASRVNLVSGLLVNTDALTSFTIVEETGSTLTAGSRFSLYGIKG